ncbi:hypothetical protein GGR26_002754 [Lewinella marina]|uniref:Cobalamin biosynthesis protein CbiG n=1 Tax=Neolewinella marina TaxID=438751 RepID=A0A2G0CCX1_9BACT|nr:hypothetical protein [Neolewinella marina]NJB86977.1 hypothetical protein [Neolewinella marina]PHK97828.1 hypothetical protein CGL56_13515 [Neolewinella marina]
MPFFDHFITIDWSARNSPSPAKPSKDAIWIAEATARGRIRCTYFRTRHACHEYLLQRLIRLRKKRVLVGWDFSFGYPKGLAKALRLKQKPAWRAIWDLISELVEDGPDNGNNRFCVGARLNERIMAPSGPFWGVPVGQSGIFLGSKCDFDYPVPTRKGPLPERRHVETLNLRLQPAWKLAYTGSVGSQALLGIPCVRFLRDHEKLRTVSRVWPFEEVAGGADAGAVIVHAEVYPSLLTIPRQKGQILDREQVRRHVAWLQEEQRAGTLGRYLDRPWGPGSKLHKRVTGHEGWVLGLVDESVPAFPRGKL